MLLLGVIGQFIEKFLIENGQDQKILINQNSSYLN